MRRLTILFLLISPVLLQGCKPFGIAGLERTALTRSTFEVPYFADAESDYIYRANISVYGAEFAGIAVLKKLSPDVHRFVLTTEFGNKLIDLEIGTNTYQVNAVVDELNHKRLLAVLVKDFRLLLQQQFEVFENFRLQQKTVLLSKQGKEHCYLYLDNNGQLEQLQRSNQRKILVAILYHTENDTFADAITVQHYDLKLKIQLRLLKNE